MNQGWRKLIGLFVKAVVLSGMGGGAALAQTPLKVTLDWKFQGPASFFLIALEKNYYAEEGLAVTLDPGQGSAGAVTRIVTNEYDLGFADINALIEYNAANSEVMGKAVMIVYDFPPFGVYALKSSGITKPEELAGKTLGAPAFDASYKLFPAFAQRVGLKHTEIHRKIVEPALREAMLIRKEVDFIAGHFFTSILDLKVQGVKAEDITVMRYSDYGLDFYGNSILASPRLLKQNPEAIRAFLRATLKGIKDMLADPDEGVAAVKRKDPRISIALESERLLLTIEGNILTPNVKQVGIGGIDRERMKRAIYQLNAAMPLKILPSPEQVFDGRFLPPVEARRL